MNRSFDRNRRRLLQTLGAGFTTASAAQMFPQLSLLRSAMAAPSGDYRALVCVYLAGANDSFNFIVPRDSDASGSWYDAYRSARGGVFSDSNTTGLALGFNDLLPISPSNQSNGFGLHPACTDFTLDNGSSSQTHAGLQSLFNSGKAAFLANVGPLVQPVTLDEYNAGAPLPAQLFSHNDQALLWELGMTDTNSPLASYGWGGRVAAAGGFSVLSNGLSPNVSIAGSARFLVGEGVFPYQMGTQGVDLLDQYQTTGASNNNYPDARRAVLDSLLNAAQNDPFAREYATITRRSLSVGEQLYGALESADGTLSTLFPATSIGSQLAMVARMIKLSRNTLGAQRQVYYVRFGSFDLHDGMFVAGQPVASSGHGALLTELNQSLGAFWAALGEAGAQDDVTTFTMSDFGRTLSSNGNGSDHAWGGHQIVMGGRVDGNKLYGRMPLMQLNANNNSEQDWSLSRGQYIPTTSVDQMAATLAQWMGVTDNAALDAIFPNLANFSSRNLGFMLG